MKHFKCICGQSDGSEDQILRRRIKSISCDGEKCIVSELRKCHICGYANWIDFNYKLDHIKMGCTYD